MRGQRRIRGCGQDSVWLTIAPDPLDERKVPMLHVAVNGGGSEVALLTLTGARRLHAALGALLAEDDE